MGEFTYLYFRVTNTNYVHPIFSASQNPRNVDYIRGRQFIFYVWWHILCFASSQQSITAYYVAHINIQNWTLTCKDRFVSFECKLCLTKMPGQFVTRRLSVLVVVMHNVWQKQKCCVAMWPWKPLRESCHGFSTPPCWAIQMNISLCLDPHVTCIIKRMRISTKHVNLQSIKTIQLPCGIGSSIGRGICNQNNNIKSCLQ